MVAWGGSAAWYLWHGRARGSPGTATCGRPSGSLRIPATDRSDGSPSAGLVPAHSHILLWVAAARGNIPGSASGTTPRPAGTGIGPPPPRHHPVPSSAGPLRSQTRARSHFLHLDVSGVTAKSPALMPDTALDIHSSAPSDFDLRLRPVGI